MMPVPIYKDGMTHETLAKQRAEIEAGPNSEEVLRELPPDSIYLDCMAFGMGAGCLQMTFQVRMGRLLGGFNIYLGLRV
jgi:hypothetical protein